MTPTDRRYSKEHEWVLVEDGKARVGITDHAQHALGDVVFVELPEVGAHFDSGESFAVVESVKAVSNVYLPLTGTVVEANVALDEQPELLNEAPYEQCIAVFEVESVDEAALMDAAAYDAFVAEEG